MGVASGVAGGGRSVPDSDRTSLPDSPDPEEGRIAIAERRKPPIAPFPGTPAPLATPPPMRPPDRPSTRPMRAWRDQRPIRDRRRRAAAAIADNAVAASRSAEGSGTDAGERLKLPALEKLD